MRKQCYATLAVLLLAGCVDHGMQDLEEYVAEVKARPPTPIDPIPQITQAETFLYIGENRRDPFMPTEEISDVLSEQTEEGPRPDPNRRKEELEFFPLDSLRMVGTLDREGQMWGLVQTPDGTIHRVKAGNYLGQNDGRIISIEEERINIVELVPNGRGGYLERQASLALGERS
ncbi:MAG TPA: pilus assembly protein PilP [Thiolapillus brandeum]|uniref:Pilus assembly protein PilP n=1 Tax=Thiolapillus brandeum TaxID=1076588 RepID=A0A7C5IYS6_9GAMM|nr:pilus assembly protein PilP [Thiolapillus brandeum]